MSEYVFTENKIEAIAFYFLSQIRKIRKETFLKIPAGKEIFSVLEDYIYNDILRGDVRNGMGLIIDTIQKLSIDTKDAELFAEYLIYCLFRRSDECQLKNGYKTNFEAEILVNYREVKRAFQCREKRLPPTILSQDIVEILRR